jgi:Holliday junction DNA helicase RuvA
VIGSLRGTIAGKDVPRLLLDVGGVGYEVETPMSTWLSLPAVGAPVQLSIHHVLREDASLLFGFATEGERTLFRALLKVSGVGPKVALAVLSGVSADVFRQLIVNGDAEALRRIPGVGRKTAERLVVELRDHFGDAGPAAGTPAGPPRDARTEAREVLLALDYKPGEVSAMLEAVGEGVQTTEELVRAALRRAVLR